MAAWLDLVKENEAWDLVDTNRLDQLVQELERLRDLRDWQKNGPIGNLIYGLSSESDWQ
jgi:hypothetical protein